MSSTDSPRIQPAGVLLPVALAADLAPHLRRMIHEIERRDGVQISTAVQAFVAQCENCRRATALAGTNSAVTAPESEATPPGAGDVENWPTIREAAAALGVTRQAVEGRIGRGTMRALRDGSDRWRVDPHDIEALRGVA